jgi:hypothetical protein
VGSSTNAAAERGTSEVAGEGHCRMRSQLAGYARCCQTEQHEIARHDAAENFTKLGEGGDVRRTAGEGQRGSQDDQRHSMLGMPVTAHP